MDRVRLAVVGCGNICQLNVPGYLEHPRCDVVAHCDTDKARADARARQWGITPTIYTDYAELLGDPEVDAVELLTPTYLHADQIVAALAAGKHVSCQKPIAVSVAEVDRIAAAVATARDVSRQDGRSGREVAGGKSGDHRDGPHQRAQARGPRARP
jgi:predicted dehydrogenase